VHHPFIQTPPRKKSTILALLLALTTPIIHAHSRGTQPASTHVQQEVRTYLQNLGVNAERTSKVRIYRISGSQKECPFGLTDRDGIWIDEKQISLYPACLCSFYLAHEAAHYALEHYRSITRIGQERAADLAAARMLCRCGRRGIVEQYAAYLKNTVIPQEGSGGRMDSQHPTFGDELAYLERVLAE